MVYNDRAILHATKKLRALAHPLRIKILAYIDKNQTINVNKIYRALRLEQSITSQHLKILRDNGMVITRREGKYIYYSVNYATIMHVQNTIDTFFKKK